MAQNFQDLFNNMSNEEYNMEQSNPPLFDQRERKQQGNSDDLSRFQVRGSQINFYVQIQDQKDKFPLKYNQIVHHTNVQYYKQMKGGLYAISINGQLNLNTGQTTLTGNDITPSTNNGNQIQNRRNNMEQEEQIKYINKNAAPLFKRLLYEQVKYPHKLARFESKYQSLLGVHTIKNSKHIKKNIKGKGENIQYLHKFIKRFHQYLRDFFGQDGRIHRLILLSRKGRPSDKILLTRSTVFFKLKKQWMAQERKKNFKQKIQMLNENEGNQQVEKTMGSQEQI